MKIEEFIKSLKLIQITYSKEYTDEQVKLFYELLKNIPDEIFKQGIKKMLLERNYTSLPIPSEIIKYCTGTDFDDKVIEASNTLRKAINSYKKNKMKFVFEDKCISEIIVLMGGMKWFMQTDTKTLEYWFNTQFVKMYKVVYDKKETLVNKDIFYGNDTGEEIKELIFKMENKNSLMII